MVRSETGNQTKTEPEPNWFELVFRTVAIYRQGREVQSVVISVKIPNLEETFRGNCQKSPSVN